MQDKKNITNLLQSILKLQKHHMKFTTANRKDYCKAFYDHQKQKTNKRPQGLMRGF